MASIFDDFKALVRFETQVWNEVERRLRTVEGAVSLGRHRILELAASEGSTRVQDISDELLITVGAASRLTDRLESDGLVARAPHPSDRRGSLVVITESGRAALQVTAPAIDSALESVLGVGGVAALAAVAGLLATTAATAEATR